MASSHWRKQIYHRKRREKKLVDGELGAGIEALGDGGGGILGGQRTTPEGEQRRNNILVEEFPAMISNRLGYWSKEPRRNGGND